MSDTLFGKEVSGTPLETRALAGDVSSQFQGLINNPGQGAQRIGEMFGINPAELGLQDFASGILSGQSPSLQGFEEANQPFQQRAQNQSQGRNASSFGTSGGRFSRNLLGANAASGAQLEQGFDQNRFQFNSAQRGQDIQALGTLLGALPGLQGASMAPLNSAAQFAQVGAPGFQEGILGELIGSAGSLAGTALTGGFSDIFSGLFGGGSEASGMPTGQGSGAVGGFGSFGGGQPNVSIGEVQGLNFDPRMLQQFQTATRGRI